MRSYQAIEMHSSSFLSLPKCLPLPENLLLKVVPVALDDVGHLVQLDLPRLGLPPHLLVQLRDVRLARLLVVVQALSHLELLQSPLSEGGKIYIYNLVYTMEQREMLPVCKDTSCSVGQKHVM